jgi:outer membrane protein
MRTALLPLLLAGTLLASPALAETLPEAIAAAYSNNPQLAAARAQVRQVDETVPLASVPTRPSVNVQGTFSQDLLENFGDAGRTWQGRLVLTQAIYQGGRVRADIDAARARVEAARANLAAVEQDVIVQTITAYADVLRLREIVRLNENQVKVLEQELRASRDRFEVGDVTRTDVAQSEARLALARANLTNAQGQEVVGRQTYERVVGRPPVALAPLPPLPQLPASPEEARQVATATNPDLIAARFNERAAERNVSSTVRQRGPNIGMQAAAQYTRIEGGPAFFGFSGFNPSIGVQLAVPIFTGGRIAAQVRQAKAVQSQQLELITLAERQVSAAAVGNYAQLNAAEAVIQSAKVQVSANELAAEGVRQENQVGSRDILDVLNAQQELLNSRVTLVTAERDRYVIAYQLLAAMGLADVALEGAPVTRYDAKANAERLKGKGFSEFGYGPDPEKDRARNTAPLIGPQP